MLMIQTFTSTYLLLLSGVVQTLAHYPSIDTNLDNKTYDHHFLDNNARKSEIHNYLESVLCNLYTPTIYVYYPENLETDLVRDLLVRLNGCQVAPLQMIKFHNIPPELSDEQPDAYSLLILSNSQVNFQTLLQFLPSDIGDKHTNRFFVVFESNELTGPWIPDLLHCFWDRQFLNVVVVFWSAGPQVYTYNPFSDDYSIHIQGDIFDSNSLFYDKLDNLHGYQMNVSLFHEEVRSNFLPNGKIRGTDGYLASLFSKRLNATFKYVQPNVKSLAFGTILKNGTPTGSLADVIEGRVNFSLNSRILLHGLFAKRVEASIPTGTDDICILVPRPKIGSRAGNLFRNFDFLVWTATVSSVVVMKLLWGCVNSFQHSPVDIKNLTIELYQSLLGQPLIKVPPNHTVRLMVAFWIIYAMLITGAYKGTLTSSLTMPPYVADINTMEQLVESQLPVLVLPNFHTYMQSVLNHSLLGRQLLQKIYNTPPEEYYGQLNANNLTVGYANREHLTTFWESKKKHMQNGQRLFNTMDVCPVPFLVVYVFPYGSPIVGKFNRFLRLTQESGIFIFWDNYLQVFPEQRRARFKKQSGEELTLSLAHLQAAFYMLAVGLQLSVAVYLWEIIQHRMQRRVSVGTKRVEVPANIFPYYN